MVRMTGLFVLASLVHFAEDGGPDGSIAVHSLAGFAWLWLGAQHALELMVAYLSLVHTPAHYARCWRRRRWAALVLAALATVVAAGPRPTYRAPAGSQFEPVEEPFGRAVENGQCGGIDFAVAMIGAWIDQRQCCAVPDDIAAPQVTVE